LKILLPLIVVQVASVIQVGNKNYCDKDVHIRDKLLSVQARCLNKITRGYAIV